MKTFLRAATALLVLSAGAQAQVINAPITEACTADFDSLYSLQVAKGGLYTGQVLGHYTTAYSAGGSGRGGGYKQGHTTVTYSQISSVVVRDSNGQLLAAFANTPNNANGYQLDNFQGSFVASTRSITVEVAGSCEYWYGVTGTPVVLGPGNANFTLSVDGPPLPPKRPPPD